jgi:hypothetical protein
VQQRLDGALDEQRLVEDDIGFELRRHVEQLSDHALTPSTTADRVGVAALLHDGRYADGWPSTRTTLF